MSEVLGELEMSLTSERREENRDNDEEAVGGTHFEAGSVDR